MITITQICRNANKTIHFSFVGNKLTSFNFGQLSDCSAIRTLDLSWNLIAEVSLVRSDQSTLHDLEEIKLQHNRLENFVVGEIVTLGIKD